jgi:hypothetical protein
MMRFTKILASLALTTVLIPLAANATTATPLNQTHQAHKAVSSALPKVQIVAAAVRRDTTQDLVQTGSANQKYPDSIGG